MRFSEEDKDLVEIIEDIGEAAMSFNIDEMTPEAKEAKKLYIDSLIRVYVDLYREGNNNEIPSKSLFVEAIDWYVDKTFEGCPLHSSKIVEDLSKTIKGIMKRLVFRSLTQYKRELGNDSYGQNVALC